MKLDHIFVTLTSSEQTFNFGSTVPIHSIHLYAWTIRDVPVSGSTPDSSFINIDIKGWQSSNQNWYHSDSRPSIPIPIGINSYQM
jgi:hypothetical protein